MNQYVPTVEEYMAVREVASGLGPPILMLMYLLGINLPEYVFRDEEYKELFRIMSTAICLMNDTQTFEVFWSDSRKIIQNIMSNNFCVVLPPFQIISLFHFFDSSILLCISTYILLRLDT